MINVSSWLPDAAAQNVDFPDTNLAEAVHTELVNIGAIGETDPITQTALVQLTQLFADNAGITNLTGLEQATGLTGLYLFGNSISDLSALSGLTSLTALDLSNNLISDLSALSGLTSLTRLTLRENSISNLGPLSGLTNLTSLRLDDNSISNLGPLSGLTNLTGLHLSGNQISDLSPLSGVTSLTTLDLESNQISDLSPLSALTSLTNLYLANNQISDLSPLSGVTNLILLSLRSNQISDLSPLSGVTSLTTLDLSDNQISDLSPLSALTSLRWLNICYNEIADISPLSGLPITTFSIDQEFHENNPGIVDGIIPGHAYVTFCEVKPEPIFEEQGIIDPVNDGIEAELLSDDGSAEMDKRRIVLRPSPVAQDRVIFNEIRNAEDDQNDWIELKNISDEPVSLKEWEISIVTPSEIKMVNKPEDAGKDEDLMAFPDYTLPAGGILLIVNTDPSETQLESGQDITDPDHSPDVPPQYLVAPEMRLPDTPYLLILRSATDKNGKPEAFEDLAGNYFRSSVYYGTHIWPLMHTHQLGKGTEAVLTQGEAWQRAVVDARGYTKAAWTSSGHQSGIGYKPDALFDTSLGTPGYPNDTVVDMGFVGRITISEVMFATTGGLFSQSQWIELYNNTSRAVMPLNLKGWKLIVEARDSEVSHRYSVIELDELYIAPNQTVLLVTRDSRNAGNLPEDQVYDLYDYHSDARKLGLRENKVLSWQGFCLTLYAPDGTLVDMAGNLDGKRGRDTPAWQLPSGRTEDGARTSLIRRYQGSVALSGTEVTSWERAADMRMPVNGYYGHKTDIGTPGYRSGGPAPVMLSHFRANRTDAGVIVEWMTASELNNAGFNILRSQVREGAFVKVNPTLILGAGTTAEQNIYTWTDTTARPNVAYYYRIEDVSLDGTRQVSVTVRMRGHLSAGGKSLQTWADLKRRE